LFKLTKKEVKKNTLKTTYFISLLGSL